MSETVLQVDGLHKAFGGVQAVEDVSFAVSAGELLALIGPNGAGKSTCFNMLNGQLAPDSGVVYLGGRNIVGITADDFKCEISVTELTPRRQIRPWV
jgi:branched-chain amino acid transport system ATP-binding protein